jgi:hypothetical protein
MPEASKVDSCRSNTAQQRLAEIYKFPIGANCPGIDRGPSLRGIDGCLAIEDAADRPF